VILMATAAAPAFAQGFDLHAAIANARDGDTIQIPAGRYSGPIVIDKAISLVAREDGVIIENDGTGDVIRITAPGVTVRGLTVRNSGKSLDRENAGITVLAPHTVIEDNTLEDVLFGIYLKDAPDCIIRGNSVGGKDLSLARRGDGIRIWESHRTLIENNFVHDARDAVMWFSDDVILRNNRIVRGRYGLHFMYSDGNILEDNRLEHNSVGAFLMYSKGLVLKRNVFAYSRGPSGYGVGLKDLDGVTAESNYFIGNRIGLQLDNSPSAVDVHDTFTNNVFAYNDIGVAFLPSVKRNHFVGNNFVDNIEQVAVMGSGEFTGNDFTVDGRGNYWSDYAGYDADESGVGDLPYVSESLFENLMDREPKLRLFLFSPAQQAIEAAAKAFPIVKPVPKFIDTAPLMTPVNVGWQPGGPTNVRAMAVLSGALLALGGLVILGSRTRLTRADLHGLPAGAMGESR
jgi:nitrous oxidase accessory protein